MIHSPPLLKLPPYGAQRMAERERGLAPRWLCVALDWRLGHAWPRIVIPADLRIAELDLRFVAGVDCIIATYPSTASRVLPVYGRLQRFRARDIRALIVGDPVQMVTLQNAYGRHVDSPASGALIAQVGGRYVA